MGWEDRLRQMVLAGGVLVGGCGSGALGGGAGGTGGITIPCGNANPDPCICGRPEASAAAAASCQAEMDCQAIGGVFIPYTLTDATGTHPPHCETDGGSPNGDGGSDGNVD